MTSGCLFKSNDDFGYGVQYGSFQKTQERTYLVESHSCFYPLLPGMAMTVSIEGDPPDCCYSPLCVLDFAVETILVPLQVTYALFTYPFSTKLKFIHFVLPDAELNEIEVRLDEHNGWEPASYCGHGVESNERPLQYTFDKDGVCSVKRSDFVKLNECFISIYRVRAGEHYSGELEGVPAIIIRDQPIGDSLKFRKRDDGAWCPVFSPTSGTP